VGGGLLSLPGFTKRDEEDRFQVRTKDEEGRWWGLERGPYLRISQKTNDIGD